ncbi:hypothetical protein [Dokdonella sp.]|uniref:hypothetical protein n=1 Tax=Dokdonella sp. TaxID=2291710 RepID=UPI0035296D97
MNQAPAEITPGRVKEEIRADAELARLRAGDLKVGIEGRTSVQRRDSVEMRDTCSLAELCQSNYISFLDQAYRILLRRSSDPAGYDAQLRLLSQGRSKIEILGNIRWSPEGRDIGVRVPWLLPRYVLAKILLIPVLGYLLEWLIGFFSLPRIIRHQRATDAFHSAREHELAEQCRSIAQQIEVIFIELGKLGSENPEMSAKLKQLFDRVGPLSEDFERISSESTELRHMVLSMNHWLSSLRRNLSALELAESEKTRKSDSFHAEISARVLQSDPHRSARLDQWSGRLASNLQESAQVLDLCSGDDWLRHLRDKGLKPTGVDTNNEIAQRAREQGQAIIVAEPASVLARSADHSLHALTALDVGCLLRRMPARQLLDETRRVLRKRAWVLFGFHGEPATIADRLDGRPEAIVDGALIAQALLAAGFEHVEQVQSADGAICVLACVGNQA